MASLAKSLLWRREGKPAVARINLLKPLSDDFQFRGPVDGSEKFIDAQHGCLLELRFTALAALKHRKRLEDNDRGIADLERQVRESRPR